MRKILFTALSFITVFALFAQTRSSKDDIARNLNIFNSIYKSLQTAYVDSIDANKTMRDAIDAMLSEIDPYTEYYPEEDQEEFFSVSTGEYGGIGSYIQQRPGHATIVSQPRAGSPAARAGLRPGDKFLMIDGDTVTSWTSSQISSKLKGQAGTPVKVTVVRPYVEDSVLTFDIVREKIEIDPLPYYGVVADGKTGYINLATFNEKSAAAVKDAFLDLKSKGIQNLVLDLRGNGGGILDGAVQILGHFLPKGTEVLRTRGRGITSEKIYKTTTQPLDTEIPLAILVDGGTASSSEIVTGAVQDLDRGIVVGSRSFGKGLVQSSRQVPYNGLLKVTVARYYTPSGRCVQALDYSHRNPDGSVARTPDSLTNVFYTKAGREVRDGGGITPDFKVEQPAVNRLVYNIVADGLNFDYANRYRAQHESVAAPGVWEVTDSLYADFKNFIDPEKLQYDKICEQIVDQLEKASKSEGYDTPEVTAQIESLRALLKHDLNHDLDQNRDMISRYLASEIMQRYYYDRGVIEESLRHDPVLDAALEVLNAPSDYRAALTPKKKEPQVLGVRF